jgi:hypothetical protein
MNKHLILFSEETFSNYMIHSKDIKLGMVFCTQDIGEKAKRKEAIRQNKTQLTG